MLSINQKVTRINSGHDNGLTGQIVEVNTTENRARVKWDHSGLRTWIKFSCLNPEPFNIHGTHTVSNAGGYEIEIAEDGETARVRDAFGAQVSTISEWLPIVDVSDDGDGIWTIDPEGLCIPLSSVMQVR